MDHLREIHTTYQERRLGRLQTFFHLGAVFRSDESALAHAVEGRCEGTRIVDIAVVPDLLDLRVIKADGLVEWDDVIVKDRLAHVGQPGGRCQSKNHLHLGVDDGRMRCGGDKEERAAKGETDKDHLLLSGGSRHVR